MLAFIFCIFALIFLQGLTDHILLYTGDNRERFKQDVMEHFGSLGASMKSLYMSVTGGQDWVVYVKIAAQAGWVYELSFIFFTFFFSFAVFNIITGMLVEKSVAAAQPDREDRVLLQRHKAAQ